MDGHPERSTTSGEVERYYIGDSLETDADIVGAPLREEAPVDNLGAGGSRYAGNLTTPCEAERSRRAGSAQDDEGLSAAGVYLDFFDQHPDYDKSKVAELVVLGDKLLRAAGSVEGAGVATATAWWERHGYHMRGIFDPPSWTN